MATKRKALSIEDKIQILKCVENKSKKKSDIAKEFGIPQSTLSTILKNKEKITERYDSGKLSISHKKMRSAKFVDVEEALYAWFKDARGKNIPVSGIILQEKAQSFAAALGYENFSVSEGWLSKFKKRHDIVCKKAHGESASVSDESIEEWKKSTAEIFTKYDARDIFNVDETGFFYRALPQHTLALKGEKCHGGKLSKDRLTVAVCCNMDGSEKRKLLIIGKSKSPRCMKGVTSLPVIYRNNSKSWMTGTIFEEWLLKFDKDMGKQKRKILLLLDNVSSHNTTVRLENVELLYLPPNTTAKLQPLDQGIIRSLKAQYRKRLLQKLILNIETGNETKINILEAMNTINWAWQDVSQDTIKNCFHASNIFSHNSTADSQENEKKLCSGEESNEVGADLSPLFNKLPGVTVQDYLNIDTDLQANQNFSLSDIIAHSAKENEDSLSEDEFINEDNQSVISATQAIGYMEKVGQYMQQRGLYSEDINKYLNQIHKVITKDALKKRRQTTINDYFKVQ